MRRNTWPNENSLRCSFCGKTQEKTGRLISNPSDRPRVYICDECVAMCAAIIEDDKVEAENIQYEDTHEEMPPHPLLAHPLASTLMGAIERWIREQSLGNDGLLAIAEIRRVAGVMLNESTEKSKASTS